MSAGARNRVCQMRSPGRYRSGFTRPNGNIATTDVIDSSVATRRTGSPGLMTRGLSSARGAARNDVYGVTNLYFARELDDFVDARAVFAVARDLVEQRVDARLRPRPRQAGVLQALGRQRRRGAHLDRRGCRARPRAVNVARPPGCV